jgi:hypothetical protein
VISSLLKFRDIALNPSEDSGMRDIDSALSPHLDQIAVAQFVGDIPTDTENDD